MVRFINDEEVKELFNPAISLQSTIRAFRALAQGTVTMPQRLSLSVPEHQGTLLTMPCYLHDEVGEILSVKVATVYGLNPKDFGLPTTMAHLILQDPKSGQLLAVMDAEMLTARRTAAASALATQMLSLEHADTLCLFGAGGQARDHIAAILGVRAISRVYILSRTARSRESLASDVRRKFGIEAIATDDVDSALSNSKIVCTATNSTNPLFAMNQVSPGTHINAIGSFRPGMREFGDDVVTGSTIIVDQIEAAKRGAGELIHAAASGDWKWETLKGDLGGLTTGRIAGRSSVEEITLFKSVGLAVQDATAADAVYRLISKSELT